MGTSATPTWMVQVVSDDVHCSACCGSGDEPAPATPSDASPGAFAYTIGLHDRGSPELHLWARPTEGDDPGADWSFSAQDMAQTLNELAELVLAGRLSAGSTHTESYDAGDATVTFRLGEAVEREQVDAFGADPAAVVLPVRWSLHRPPPGELGPADLGMVGLCREMLLGLAPRPSRVALLPASWRSDALDFDPHGDHGPMTPLVRGIAAAVVGGGPDQQARFLLECASGYTTGTSAGHVLAMVRAAARRSGRLGGVDRLDEEVEELVGAVVEDGSWPAVVAAATDALGPWPTASDDLAGLLRRGLLAALSTAVVRDVADRELLLAGTGPFRWSRSGSVGAPPEFLAPESVVRAVAEVLGHLRARELPELLTRHHVACGDVRYLDAVAHLQGLAVTDATSVDTIDAVLPRPVARRARRDRVVGPTWTWAALLVGAACAASADPRRLSLELTDALCAPYDDLVPGLRRLLTSGRDRRP
ncbi:hypothetical protein [Nocardioides sp. CFH 31398]|uniref:hypothetical protein n=1 Tax=Nocardioides sp. CFH 31398 TaxID=2919579 RepID=UPI001F05C651|nr:hypothetical protein [Nocardioides sp. CFH 31398]MCH1868143.1 hypothetical protein [Nocardioides sp. CFH 31398]